MFDFWKQSNQLVENEVNPFICKKQKLIICKESFHVDKRNTKFKEAGELTSRFSGTSTISGKIGLKFYY